MNGFLVFLLALLFCSVPTGWVAAGLSFEWACDTGPVLPTKQFVRRWNKSFLLFWAVLTAVMFVIVFCLIRQKVETTPKATEPHVQSSSAL